MAAKDRSAFAMGYAHGNAYGPASPNDAYTALHGTIIEPTTDAVTAFCCGSDDGHTGDTFRLCLMSK